MAAVAAQLLGAAVEFEIPIVNADKPALDYLEIDSRVRQFGADEPVWLSRAATFVEKSFLFPGVDVRRRRRHDRADRRGSVLWRRSRGRRSGDADDRCPRLSVPGFRPQPRGPVSRAGRPGPAAGGGSVCAAKSPRHRFVSMSRPPRCAAERSRRRVNRLPSGPRVGRSFAWNCLFCRPPACRRGPGGSSCNCSGETETLYLRAIDRHCCLPPPGRQSRRFPADVRSSTVYRRR